MAAKAIKKSELKKCIAEAVTDAVVAEIAIDRERINSRLEHIEKELRDLWAEVEAAQRAWHELAKQRKTEG
jgi:tetrahydromethanopterin S-methyltransferase subunit G